MERSHVTGLEGLTPTQRSAVIGLEAAMKLGSVVALNGADGCGKTTILRALHAAVGGRFLAATDFVDALCARDPSNVEEAVCEVVVKALHDEPCVIVDDFDVLAQAMNANMNPRRGLIEAVLKSLCEHAREHSRRLVVATHGATSDALGQVAYAISIVSIDVEDYQVVIRNTLGAQAHGIDAARIHRAAPKLGLHMLSKTCCLLQQRAQGQPLSTEDFLEYLAAQRLANNVDLSKVVPTELRQLHGVEHVIEALEAHVVLPLEDEALARELKLQPKRGVLLVGPPGTGKTTIGKALAHRLRGRFFLLDGTAIAGTGDFYQRLTSTFREAQQNAPSVIFVDDSDVLFGGGNPGIYRYFLTQLDGLEGRRADRVCVVMTVMGVEGLPPALIRSGRLELWLELELPNEQAREQMFRDLLSVAPEPIASADPVALARETAGFSGADVRRVVEDSKLLYAYGRSRNPAEVSVSAVLRDAIRSVVANKEKYAQAVARAAQAKGVDPSVEDDE